MRGRGSIEIDVWMLEEAVAGFVFVCCGDEGRYIQEQCAMRTWRLKISWLSTRQAEGGSLVTHK
jgi:hypothetical protein